jgi:hypothetical protein
VITHRTCVDVDAVTPGRIYDLMVNPTDAAYRQWWPGTHTRFHVVRRDSSTSPTGDVVVMDERVGRRRLRFHGVVRVAEPGRRIVWQLRKVVTAPAWLDVTLCDIPSGTRVEHTLRLGFSGLLGTLTDPLIRLYFTDEFANALTAHAKTEFLLLSPKQGMPGPAR